MDTSNRQKIGQEAERLACKFLQAKGLRLLEQNYRCYYGEIDLIMQDQDDIVFVEVRCRHRIDFGNALESINKNKMNKLYRAANHFLQKKQWLYKISSRFDIVAIHPVSGKMRLEWVKNAFSVE